MFTREIVPPATVGNASGAAQRGFHTARLANDQQCRILDVEGLGAARFHQREISDVVPGRRISTHESSSLQHQLGPARNGRSGGRRRAAAGVAAAGAARRRHCGGGRRRWRIGGSGRCARCVRSIGGGGTEISGTLVSARPRLLHPA
jgi:hypothetical protein